MDPLITVILLVLCLLAIAGVFCLRRMALERRTNGELRTLTATLIWTVYFSFTGVAVAVSWFGVWPLPLPRTLALGLGTTALLLGLTLIAGGMYAFRSVARMSGRNHEELIRHGVYRWTRNPQNVGWGAALVGAALMGRSGLALLFALFFLVAFRLYVPVEERHMERCFGDDWRRYRASTPRFFGIPARERRPARPQQAETARTAVSLTEG